MPIFRRSSPLRMAEASPSPTEKIRPIVPTTPTHPCNSRREHMTQKLTTVPSAVDASAKKAELPDPLAIDSLRLDLNYLETGAVERLLTSIPIRRPSKQEFFRTHPSE